MPNIIEYFSWSAGAFVAWMVFAVGLLAAVGPVNKQFDRQRVRAILADDAGKGLYRRFMTRRLRWLDYRLSRTEIRKKKGLVARAWSADLAGVTLLITFSYPILSIAIQWVIGSPLTIGSLQIEQAGDPTSRFVLAVALVSAAFFYAFAAMLKSAWSMVSLAAAVAIMFAVLFYGNWIGIPSVAAAAGGLAFVVVQSAAATVTVAVGTSITFATGTEGVVAALVAGGYALGVTLFFARIEHRKGRHPLWYMGPTIALQGFLIAAIVLYWAPSNSEFVVYLVLFFGILPFLNALFDFASYGLSRYFIVRGLTGSIWANFFWDFLGAIVAFFGLGFAIIAYVAVIHPPTGPLIDLSAIFMQLQTDRGSFGWLGFMLFSTFVPTVIHAIIFIITSGIGQIALFRNLLLSSLDTANPKHSDSGFAAIGFYAILSVSVFLILWIPWTLVKLISLMPHGDLLTAIIWVFESFARAIGAI